MDVLNMVHHASPLGITSGGLLGVEAAVQYGWKVVTLAELLRSCVEGGETLKRTTITAALHDLDFLAERPDRSLSSGKVCKKASDCEKQDSLV